MPDNYEWEPVATASEWQPVESSGEWDAVPQTATATTPAPESPTVRPVEINPEVSRSVPDIRNVTQGGPRVALPDAGVALRVAGDEILQGIGEVQTHESPIPTPFSIDRNDHPMTAVGKEVVNLAVGVPQFFTTALGIEAVAAGAAAPTVVAGAFTVDLLKNLGEHVLSTYKNWSQMNTTEKSVAVTDAIGTGALAGLTGKATIKGATAYAEGFVPRGTGISPALAALAPLTAQAVSPSEKPKESSADKIQTPMAVASGESAEPVPKVAEGIPGEVQQAPSAQNESSLTPATDAAVAESIPSSAKPSETATATEQPTNVPVSGEPNAPPPPVKPSELAGETTAEFSPPPSEDATAPDNLGPGLGAAKAGEVAVQGNPDIYGVAERVREERAKAGQVDPVPPGEGIAPADSVQLGRELIKQGRSAEGTISLFEKTKALSSEDMAVVRAHGEELALAARRIEEQSGTDSPEYKVARDALSDWDRRSKAMQTEWAKTGQAQQGETDIDTGSFTGLARAFKDETGKDFTPKQEKVAKKKASAKKQADEEAATAKTALFKHLDDAASMSEAERRAEKTIQESAAWNAIRGAREENKKRISDAVAKRDLAKVQEEAARRALKTIQKENSRENIRLARAENKKRISDAVRAKETAQIEIQNENRIANLIEKEAAKTAIRLAREENKSRVARADKSKFLWDKAREYINNGMENFDDIRNRLAVDTGMSVNEVTKALGHTQREKFLTNDLWKKQQIARRLGQMAKQWLRDTTLPGYRRAFENVPKILFTLKVGFHGTVALGTHAPTVAFQPRFWKTYVQDFAKMYAMVNPIKGKGVAYYEMQVSDLVRRKNYITARRAGLVNDPLQYEDFNSPDVSKYMGAITQMGNRGYTILKILRQDMFDQHWDSLPRSLQQREFAAAIADAVNHATGVVKVSPPKGTAVALFAPRLEMSRVAWLLADPAIAMKTALEWKTATRAEKYFAIQQMKEKAWVAGTLYGLLALNQGFLNATHSDQKVNGIPEFLGGSGFDPMKGDFFKFKVAGMQISYGNAMLTMARLPIRLYEIRESDGGKLKNLVHPDESTYTVLGEYARSQMSPFASLVSSLWFKADWQNRPLPSSNRPVPKRLAAHGVKPYTWPEFWTEQVLPIPFEEAAREVWHTGLGMSDAQISQMRKAMATIAIMSATGARLSDDWEVGSSRNRPLSTSGIQPTKK